MYFYMLTITWENVLLHVNNYLRNKIYFYMLTITWENVLNAEDLIYQLHLIASEKRVLLVRLYVKQCSAVVAIFDFIQTQKHPTKYSRFFLHYYLPSLVTFVKVIPAKMIGTWNSTMTDTK